MREQASSEDQRGATLDALNRELRWGNAYAVLFSHLLARRAGINSTDLEAHDILTLSGPIPAGRLAALTGLTTGAATSLIDRLEDARLARREPDSADRRRVIVRALPPPDQMASRIMPEFEALGRRIDELFAEYDDAGLALIHQFLARANAIAAAQIAALGDDQPPSEVVANAPYRSKR